MLFEYAPITDAFAKVRAAGRAIHLGFCLGKHGVMLSLFNVYGHSGGAQDKKKALATSRILAACIEESLLYPEAPKFLTGDLNGDFGSFPQLATLRNDMGWTDLNEAAETWGQSPPQPDMQNHPEQRGDHS
jgi:hypothetical protein